MAEGASGGSETGAVEPSTTVSSDRLVKLLEEEARLAREKAAVEPEVEDEGVITVPDLPPYPGSKERKVVVPLHGAGRREAAEVEATPTIRTERTEPPPIEPDHEQPLQVAPRARGAAWVSFLREGGPETDEAFRPRPPPVYRPLEPLECDLSAESVPALFWRAHVQQVTGRLLFVSGQEEKEVFFEEGVPIAARSNLAADRLEDMLLRFGLLDRATHAQARVKGIEHPRALAAHLVERGLLRAEEFFPVVRRHLEEVLLSLFEWPEGAARFDDQVVPDPEKVRLSRPMAALIMEGIRRKYLLPRLVQAVGGPSSLLAPIPPEHRGPGSPDPASLMLSAGEREVLRRVDGLRPIEEIVFLSGREALEVYRVLFAGVVTGLLVVTAPGLRDGAQTDPRAEQRDLEIGRRRVEAKFEELDRVSYFEVLGVSSRATPYEIEEAFRRLQREFHPMRFTHPAYQALQGKLDAIRRAVEEAFEVLSDEVLREEYRKSSQ